MKKRSNYIIAISLALIVFSLNISSTIGLKVETSINNGNVFDSNKHNVTAFFDDNKLLINFETLSLTQNCNSCNNNAACSNSILSSSIVKMTDEEIIIVYEYEYEDGFHELIVNNNLEYFKTWNTGESAGGLYLTSSVIRNKDAEISYYILDFFSQTPYYNLTVSTRLHKLNSEIYASSSTLINLKPLNTGITTIEYVNITSSVKLSELFSIYGKISKEINKIYQKSDNYSLNDISRNYKFIFEEMNFLSKTIENDLSPFDLPILQNTGKIVDACGDWLCLLVCGAACLIGCGAGSAVICGAACATSCAGCWTIWACPWCILCVAACGGVAAAVCAVIQTYGCNPGCDWICCQI
jgi:hypothetical protein